MDNKTRFFFDMDGVLAEFNFDLPSLDALYEKDYFLKRPPQQNIVDAARQMIAAGDEVFILSAVLKDSEYALFEKHDWLDEHLPEANCKHRIFTICGEDKISYVPHFNPKTDILVDDFGENCLVWRRAGGTFVKVSRNEEDGAYESEKHTHVIHPAMPAEDIVKAIRQSAER